MPSIQRILRLFSKRDTSSPGDSRGDLEAALNLIDRGHAAQDAGHLDEARELYQAAIAAAPGLARAHMNLGNALLADGDTERALAAYQAAVAREPNFAPAHYSLGNAYWHKDKTDLALSAYRSAAQADPAFVMPWIAMANTLCDLRRFNEAIEASRRAITIDPGNPDAHYALGRTFIHAGKLHDAAESLRNVIEIDPNHLKAYANLALYHEEFMRFDEAIKQYRKIINIAPHEPGYWTNFLFRLSHEESISPIDLFREHVTFGTQLERSVANEWPTHANTRDPNRPIRIGFVSADLREHAVANFVEPIFRGLARRSDLILIAYHNNPSDGVVTNRIRSLFAHWRTVSGMSDETLSKQIQQDRVDILIDLSGHTTGNRLATFARKPSPIQVSWIGYPGTTGMRAMDYYVSDPNFLPHETFAAYFTENLVHIPANSLFTSYQHAPEVNDLPAAKGVPFTFASFNRPNKISRQCINRWSRILDATPGTRILIAGISHADQASTISRWLKEEGIDLSRVTYRNRTDTLSYMQLHHQVDLCLDTFPYSGGTTTNHALWMGVPTLTMIGNTPASRQTTCVLKHLELPLLIARNPEELVNLGKYWSQNVGELSSIRKGLRDRIESSSICDTELICSSFSDALRAMWRKWCNNEPPAYIDLSSPKGRNNRRIVHT